ncbi:MAG: zf-TFIIB domain-containing protein [Deltaproteobacteria bacterium]|nr:zf-TFIIB domain-containing protein [Deltaproteobacteria bacterium]
MDPRLREIDRCSACQGVWFDKGEMVRGLEEAALVDPASASRDFARRPIIVTSHSGVRVSGLMEANFPNLPRQELHSEHSKRRNSPNLSFSTTLV